MKRKFSQKVRYATGGRPDLHRTVGISNPNPPVLLGPEDAPQTRGSELTQEQYETYGFGPEHNFFGTRSIPEVGSFMTQGPSRLQPPTSGSSSDYGNYLLAALGLAAGRDVYKNLRDRNQDETIPTTLDLDKLHREASDTSRLNDWAENYLQNLPAPTLEGFSDIPSSDFWSRMDAAARDTSYLDALGEDYLSNLPAPVLAEMDKSLWDYLDAGVDTGMGALNLYAGLESGDVGGYGQALRGASSLADVAGFDSAGDALGSAGKVLSGIDQGGVKGYGQATAGAIDLAGQAGYNVPGTEAISKALGPALALYGAYTGLEGVGDAYHAGDVKSGMMSGASAGASAGSLLGPLGTAAGAVIGGTLGTLYSGSGSSKIEAANEGAWDAFRKNLDEGAESFRNSGFPLSQAFEAATNATGFKELDNYMRQGVKSSGFPPQLHARNTLIREIEEAQRDGRLPTEDSDLNRVSGVNFFKQEIAPKIWGDKKVDPDLVDLMAHMTDNLFSHGREGWQGKQIDYSSMDHRGLSEAASRGDEQAMAELRKRQGFARGGLSRMNYRLGGLSRARSMVPLNNPTPYYRYGQTSAQPPVRRAMGGGLLMGYNQGGPPGVPRLVRGPGTGRSDDIPALLSDGEYVFDAETVALLGDGSTDEGARRLDALRKKLRMHKGKQLAKGKFSSPSKNPEDYLE